MTKEESIKNDNTLDLPSDGWQTMYSHKDVLKLMDEYAKQQAIEFAKWCIKNDYWNHPNVKTFGIDGKMNEGFKSLWYKRGRSVGGITDNAIYELYLLQSKQQ